METSGQNTPLKTARAVRGLRLVAVAVGLLLPSSAAAEQADEFLEALKRRGYFDMAIEYVDRAPANSLISAAWSEASDYHRGVLRIEQARETRDKDQAEAQLTAGIEALQEFCQQQPDHALTGRARTWLAKSLAQQARLELIRFRDAGTGKKAAHAKSAGAMFKKAASEFTARIKAINAELDTVAQDTGASAERRDTLRTDLIGARLEAAMIEFERAELVAGDEKAHRKQIETASKAFAELAKDYNKRLVGFEARYFQGRCCEELDEPKEALSYYTPFFEETELPLSVAAKPIGRAIACWSEPPINDPTKAIGAGEEWLKRLKPARDSVEVAPVRLALAKAYQAQIASASPSEARKAQRSMRSLLLAASSVPGAHQNEARQLLAQTQPAASDLDVDPNKWRTFSEAREAGEEAHQQVLATDALLEMLNRNLETVADAANRAEIQQQIEEAQSQQASLQDQALVAFRRALRLASPSDDKGQVRQLQYLTAFLMYQDGQHYDAAVLGGHSATRYPQSPVARQCANVAMASLWQLYQLAEGDVEREAATQRIIRIADFIARTWPSDPSAQDALANLVSFMVNEGNTTQAIEYLGQIPESSPQRASAELRVGQAIWRQYLTQLDEHAKANPQSRLMAVPPELDQLRLRALDVLRTGLDRAEPLETDQNIAQAALTLAQACIESGEIDDAERHLNHPQYGPLTLLDESNPIGNAPGFAEQTYKTLVRAKIARLPHAGASSNQVLDEALKALDRMKSSVGDSADARKRLTSNYMALARDLKRQLDVAPPQARPAIAKGFETFVSRVTGATTDANILNWAGETLMSLAESSGNEAAESYHQRAAEAFQSLLDGAQSASPPIEAGLLRQAKLRLATAKRKLNLHQEAINLLDEVLQERNALLNVQAEAALTYQEAGEFGALKLFDLAIKGGRKNAATGKNNIWGWEGIAARTAAQMKQDPEKRARFSDAFFESRYNIALCRYRQSVKSQGAQKKEYLSQARRSVSFTTRLYPDLGGPVWKRKFEELQSKIEAGAS